MILSILICTLPERKEMFEDLIKKIAEQEILEYAGLVEVCVHNGGRNEYTTGEKRNELLSYAKGKYCVFVDDDDEVPPYYIEELFKASHSDADCLAINGTMTTNGVNEKQWFIGLGNPYIADYSTGKEIYLRPPNHITPMKTEIARHVGFKGITIGEDYDFCMRLKESGLLKTQYVIEKPMYHYKFIENK